MSKEQYYIVCKRHMHRTEGAVLFWGPNNAGYRYDINSAGLYTEEEAKKFDGNHHHDMPVPQKLVDELSEEKVIDRKILGRVVMNTKKNRKILGIKLTELVTGPTVWETRVFVDPGEFVMMYSDVVALIGKIGMQKRCRCEGKVTYVKVCKKCGGCYDGGGI